MAQNPYESPLDSNRVQTDPSQAQRWTTRRFVILSLGLPASIVTAWIGMVAGQAAVYLINPEHGTPLLANDVPLAIATPLGAIVMVATTLAIFVRLSRRYG